MVLPTNKSKLPKDIFKVIVFTHRDTHHTDTGTQRSILCARPTGQFIPGVDADGISYIWIPWHDNKMKVESYVEFEVEACAETDIKFSAKVLAPTGNDDSVFLKMDEEERVPWQVGGGANQWTWKTLRTPFKLTAGKHKLRVLHREVRALNLFAT